MSSYNNQHGLNNSHGGGGEYNNDAAAANKQENQEQEFVSPSLCIPRTHANIRKERIFAVIRSLGLGWIGRIDVVEKMDEKGTPFIRVFIHFTKWFQNAQTRHFLEHLETQKSANIVYDEPWFWKVTKSFVPAPPVPVPQQQQEQPSRFPKPRIDFEGASTRIQQAEQEQQVAAVVSSKTPSSNASGTNAVSGKGKQVAKRMGYESGKGLGKKADGRLVPVQIKKNVGRNGVGLGSAVVAVADAVAVVDVADAIALAVVDTTSSDYWTTHAHDGYTQAQLFEFAKRAFPKALEQISVAAAVEPRLSVSVSPPKLERRLFHNDCCCDDDGVASVVYKMNKSNSA
uniref:G-patch domain-containing protein n=1 Tax=viral metagenome TaxID=1070528 RepID=A0A6C0I2A4_9ZZZZ